jgi:hypothetical protein
MTQTREHGVAMYVVYHRYWPVSFNWIDKTYYFETAEDAALWLAKETGLLE